MRRSNESLQLLPNPYAGANFLSVWTFWYSLQIFKKGNKRDLTEADLTVPLDAHKSSIMGDKLARAWCKEVDRCLGKKHKRASLLRALNNVFGLELFGYGILAVVAELGIRIHQPLFIGLLLRYFDARNDEKPLSNMYPRYFNRVLRYWYPDQSQIVHAEAVLYLLGVIMCSVLNCLIMHPYMMGVGHVGMKMRVAACSLMYRKTLRLSFISLGGKTVGNIMNLMANDVNRFDNVTIFTPFIFIGPMQLCFACYFIYWEIGVGAFFGTIVIICAIIIQVNLGQCTLVQRRSTAKKSDERVFLMNEVIQGIQVIKMYAWEYIFEEIIKRARKVELLSLMRNSYIKGTIMSFIMFTTRFAAFITVFTAVYTGNVLSVEQVFFIVGYYQIMRHTMTVNFPQGIANLAEFDVAVERIREFLLLEESNVGDPTPYSENWATTSKKYAGYTRPQPFVGTNNHIVIKNAYLRFGTKTVLEDVSLVVKQGYLTVLVGEVGSGKSCMLHMIMGEILPFRGTMQTQGIVSYSSQEPWLFAGSVRQNILFGHDYNRMRYQQVIQLCALARDLTLLPYGDKTIVGERGISLSGGQRARVNLARAIYKNADIYLLDDPLSAVDPSVGRHLFEKCITNYLKDKIVILCTHQLQFLQSVPQIVLLKRGKIEMAGSFAELQASGISFTTFLKGKAEEKEIKEHTVAAIIQSIPMQSIDNDHPEKIPTMEAEQQTSGAIGCGVYQGYFTAGGNLIMILLIVFLFILSQVFISSADFFLNAWIQSEQAYNIYHKPLETPYQEFCHGYCIYLFAGSIALLTVVSLSRSYYFYFFCMRASYKIHQMMFRCLAKTHMRFFFSNTSGRILNRFSKDLGTVDEYLPNSFLDFNQLSLNLLGTVVIFVIINPYLIIPSICMVVFFYFVRKYYMRTSRSIKRLEGSTKSPVYSHLNATLQGVATIRSHSTETLLVSEFDSYQDYHSSAFFLFTVTSRAFGYSMDLLCVLYIVIVSTFFFLLTGTERTDAGLCITQCMGLTGLFQWGMRQGAELENFMTSVERVLEYTKLEVEGEYDSRVGKKPPLKWPQHGKVEFRNTVLRYSLLEPPVLNRISFIIYPKEKIGIVGRTGAGKSTLISALFRLAYIEGKIIIDGIDTSTIGLHDLRRKISIIPQEPVLFTGTLRSNLDPFNEYKDKDMLEALLAVEIKVAAVAGIACLNYPMAEGGVNYSVGERQLICLARAIIRNNCVLIMDEATANVDPQTDKFIQSTIRTTFAKCTVLTVAHRLNTVIDSDRVLVMDAGKSVEFDHPHLLLQIKNGHFSQMVEKTGAGNAENLRKFALESYKNKFGKSGTKITGSSSKVGGTSASKVAGAKTDDTDDDIDDDTEDDDDDDSDTIYI